MSRARVPAFALPVSATDVVRHALAAYYRAVGDAVAPVDYPDDPADWGGPEDFLETLVDLFQLRVRSQAARDGHPVDHDTERLARWLDSPPFRDQCMRDLEPSAAPAEETAERSSMGHGCPALDPAVGPAAGSPEPPDITAHGDPLLHACPVQELPSPIAEAYASPAPAEVPHA